MIQYPFEANHVISLIAYPPSVLDTVGAKLAFCFPFRDPHLWAFVDSVISPPYYTTLLLGFRDFELDLILPPACFVDQ